MANIRAAYAECATTVLTEEETGGAKLDSTKTSASKEVTLTQTKKNWTGENGKDVAGVDITGTVAKSDSPKGTIVVVTVNDAGAPTIADKAGA